MLGHGRTAATTVACWLAVALAAGAGAEAAAASRWPGAVVTYRNFTAHPNQVRRAVALWNRAVTRPWLVPARGGRAQIRIFPSSAGGDGAGRAYGYYPPDGRVFMGTAWKRTRDFSDNPNTPGPVNLVVHELGHALGLDHGPGCRIMNGDILIDRDHAPCLGAGRRLPQLWTLCGPQLADARIVAARYGGRVRRRARFGACPPPRYPAPPAPAGRLAAPVGPVWLASTRFGRSTTVKVRVANAGRWTWGQSTRGAFGDESDDVWLRMVEPAAYQDCGFLPSFPGRYPRRPAYLRSTPPETVRPGATGSFDVDLCPPRGTDPIRALRFQLEATGPGGTRVGPAFTVTVRRDDPPAAAFDLAPAADLLPPGTTVQFTDRSTDDRGVVRREWSFGDPDSGAADSSAAANPAHTFAAAGFYGVTLTVTDTAGNTSSTTRSVTVGTPDPPPEP